MMGGYKLIMFDLDGTLIEPFKGPETIKPGVMEFFASISGLDFPKVGIVTNQGGPALRLWMENDGWGDPDSLPTVGDIVQNIMSIRQKIVGDSELNLPCYISTAYVTKAGTPSPYIPYLSDVRLIALASQGIHVLPEFSARKPNTEMLTRCSDGFGIHPTNCLMVGDHSSDKDAADHFGCDLMFASEFFEGGHGSKKVF